MHYNSRSLSLSHFDVSVLKKKNNGKTTLQGPET